MDVIIALFTIAFGLMFMCGVGLGLWFMFNMVRISVNEMKAGRF